MNSSSESTHASPGRNLSLTALPVADAARVLVAAGWREASVTLLQQDIAAGAPVNHDGTLNLLTYTAWLIRELENAHT